MTDAPQAETIVEYERGLIGAMQGDPADAEAILESGLERSMFFDPKHSAIFAAIARSRTRGILEVKDLLRADGLNEIADCLHLFVDASSPSSQIAFYIAKIREAHHRRELRRILMQNAEDANDGDLPTVIESTRQRLDELQVDRANAYDFITADKWLTNEAPEPDQIIRDFWDVCDKLAIIAPPKMRKSFFLLQLLVAISTGQDFAGLKSARPRKVLLVNLEIRGVHLHRRLQKMARRLNADVELLGQNLVIVNARDRKGAKISMVEIKRMAKAIGAEVIVFDPLYKLHQGDENTAKDMKPIMAEFDALAEATGAGIAYVHHDAKGASGDRNIRDRGAGSNTTSRDYDAGITLTQHRTESDAVVMEYMTRNYAPREATVIRWDEGAFTTANDLTTAKETAMGNSGRSASSTKEASEYAGQAMTLVEKKPIPVTTFHDSLRSKLSLPEHKARALIHLLTESGQLEKSKRLGLGGNVLIGTPEQIRAAVFEHENPGLSYSSTKAPKAQVSSENGGAE